MQPCPQSKIDKRYAWVTDSLDSIPITRGGFNYVTNWDSVRFDFTGENRLIKLSLVPQDVYRLLPMTKRR